MKSQPKSTRSSFPPLLSLTYVLQQSADELLLKEARVSLSHARIMSALSLSPASQHAVALALNQTEANVSRQLQVMKKQGLVSITKNKKDRRQRDVSLTKKGQSTYQKAKKLLASQQSKILRAINKGETDAVAFAIAKLTKKA